MRTYMIIFNQSFSEEILETLNALEIRGFTRFNELQGRGSKTGNPHMGSHSWPELNNAILSVVEESKGQELVKAMTSLNQNGEEQGLHVFSWESKIEL